MSARLLVSLLLGLLVAFAPAGQALARTIGIVFDDSGSMAPRIHLPAFGAQLLVSTLDGRAGHDRLFSIRLSEPAVTAVDLRTADRIGATIDMIRQRWTYNPHSDTPYRPIELMLDKLVQETAPGEQAYLLVITDGDFNRPNPLPSPQQLRASYEAYKRRMPGQLQVMWLFIDRTGELRPIADQQQVYSTMVDVFGGDRQQDVRFVSHEDQLKDALVHFVSKISGTDLDRNNTVMRRSGNAIDLDLPFSVTRIISIGIGSDESRLPALQSPAFAAERLRFKPSMAQADGEFPTRLFGEVTQLRMEPALGTGRHRIEYSGPVGDETILLFRSEIGLTWKLMDGDNELHAGPGGLIEPSLGHKYKIVAQVQDRVAGAGVVSPSRIPNAVVTLTIVDPGGRATALTLTPSDKDKGFVADHVFTAEGQYEISAALRLPGFVTSRSDAVSVHVVPRALGLVMRLARVEPCPSGSSCPGDVVPVRVQPAGTPAGAVGFIEVIGTPPRGRSGQFRLEVENLPKGYQLVGPGRRPVRPDLTYDVGAGGTVRFDIVRPAGWRPAFGAAPVETTVKALAAQPLEGEASLRFHIEPNMPNPVLSYRGHDQDRSGHRPLSLDLAAADHAGQGFDFTIENALDLPTQRNLSVSFDSGVVGFFSKADIHLPPSSSALASGYAFSVHPRVSWWCQCLLGLALWAGVSPDAVVTVSYDPRDGRSPVSAQAPLRLTTESWSPVRLWSGCLWLVLLALFIAYVLRVIYALLAAYRFPPKSRFYIFEAGFIEPLAKKVRNSLWSDLWSALLLRIPRHRYRLDSLIVEADGAQLRLRTTAHDWPSYRSMRHGKLLQDMADQMVKRNQAKRASDAILAMSWDSVIEDPLPSGRRIVFVRNFSRRPEAAVTRDLAA
jgi:hypothetical protein